VGLKNKKKVYISIYKKNNYKSNLYMPIGVPKVPFRLPGEEDAVWVDV
jgi:hypothetical protein